MNCFMDQGNQSLDLKTIGTEQLMKVQKQAFQKM